MKNLKNLNLKEKKYIIFDIDGTLIDSIGVWNKTDQIIIEKLAKKKVDLNTIQIDRDNFLNDNQDSDIYLAYCEYLIKKYRFNTIDANELLKRRWNISNEILEKDMDFKPNAVKLILRLKKMGFVLVLATMTTQTQLEVYSKKNIKMARQMNINDVFNLILKKEDVKSKKPNPEIYNKVMLHYNAKPNECLTFEDSYAGVLASKNAGIEVINIYDKYADLDRDKINAIADYTIKDYEELVKYLELL
ncbi:MAG: HAD family phosphatase [Bacilli bacterium]|nr:HAD family phosphatase [Bacilli bacterium]